ncbi:MAG: helix-turn-helix domain-containing protein [Erythrobacter sp.]
MANELEPWSLYVGRDALISAGRKSLIAAFGEVVTSSAGVLPHELPEVFSAPADEGDNDLVRDLVKADAERLMEALVHDKIACFARPMSGGDIVPMPASMWEIDDPLPRMAIGAFNMQDWANPAALPTHRIFVDATQFDQWLATIRDTGSLSARQVEEIIDPTLRAARAVARKRISEEAENFETGSLQAENPIAPSFSDTAKTDRSLGLGPMLLSIGQVADLVRRGRSTIYQMVKDGDFPEPLKIGSSSRWKKHEILLWIEEQAAKRGESRS